LEIGSNNKDHDDLEVATVASGYEEPILCRKRTFSGSSSGNSDGLRTMSGFGVACETAVITPTNQLSMVFTSPRKSMSPLMSSINKVTLPVAVESRGLYSPDDEIMELDPESEDEKANDCVERCSAPTECENPVNNTLKTKALVNECNLPENPMSVASVFAEDSITSPQIFPGRSPLINSTVESCESNAAWKKESSFNAIGLPVLSNLSPIAGSSLQNARKRHIIPISSIHSGNLGMDENRSSEDETYFSQSAFSESPQSCRRSMESGYESSSADLVTKSPFSLDRVSNWLLQGENSEVTLERSFPTCARHGLLPDCNEMENFQSAELARSQKEIMDNDACSKSILTTMDIASPSEPLLQSCDEVYDNDINHGPLTFTTPIEGNSSSLVHPSSNNNQGVTLGCLPQSESTTPIPTLLCSTSKQVEIQSTPTTSAASDLGYAVHSDAIRATASSTVEKTVHSIPCPRHGLGVDQAIILDTTFARKVEKQAGKQSTVGRPHRSRKPLKSTGCKGKSSAREIPFVRSLPSVKRRRGAFVGPKSKRPKGLDTFAEDSSSDETDLQPPRCRTRRSQTLVVELETNVARRKQCSSSAKAISPNRDVPMPPSCGIGSAIPSTDKNESCDKKEAISHPIGVVPSPTEQVNATKHANPSNFVPPTIIMPIFINPIVICGNVTGSLPSTTPASPSFTTKSESGEQAPSASPAQGQFLGELTQILARFLQPHQV
jgi:hypothetical protein